MFKALIVALAAVAAAIPTSPQPSGSNVNQCSNGILKCCNKEAAGQALSVDALDSPCSLNALKDLVDNKCTGQTVCCNNVKQYGLVNVACTPVNV